MGAVLASPGFVFSAAALGAVIAAAALLARPARSRHEAQHAAPPKRPAHARRDLEELSDPRDVSDPDGAVWVALLSAPVQAAPLEWRPFIHHERPVLERVRAGLLALPVAGEVAISWLPADPPAADTGELPVVVCELGMPVDEYVEGLFAAAAAEAEAAA